MPHGTRVADRLKALEFLVVSEFFLSETAMLADVVLPSAQWAEEDGTMTNLEGRVILRRRAIDPPAGVRTDLETLSALAAALGKGRFFPIADSREVFAELCRATEGAPADYSGITYERITAEDGVFWPCPAIDHPGTPRLFTESFPTPTGRARFHAVPHGAPVDARDDEYPLFLTTGRVLAHYQSRTQTRHVSELEEGSPEPLAEMHPVTARQLGLANGERVTLTTRRAAGTFTLKVTPTTREDTVFVAFHWGGMQSINRLTSEALDPISRMPEFKVCAVRASAESSATRMSAKRRLVVVGNGMAGARLVEELLARGGGNHHDVTMFGDEPCGNYNRILLSSVLARSHDPKDIFINPLPWYAGQRRHAARGRARREDRRGREGDHGREGHGRTLRLSGDRDGKPPGRSAD